MSQEAASPAQSISELRDEQSPNCTNAIQANAVQIRLRGCHATVIFAPYHLLEAAPTQHDAQ